MKNLYIHIGLHKTGTTHLQNNIFPYIPDVSIIRGFDLHRKLIYVPANNDILITDEGLSGKLWEGTYYQDFFNYAVKIKELYLNPKIILGVRDQKKIIISLYKQYLHEGGSLSFNHFFNKHDTGIFKLKDFLFLPRIQYIKDNFDDVFLYSQESLKERENDFTNALLKFMEIKSNILSQKKPKKFSNVGVSSQLQVNTLMKLNRFNKRLKNSLLPIDLYSSFYRKKNITPRDICQNHLKDLKSDEFKIKSETYKFITDYYKEDWHNCIKLISY